MEVLPAIPVIIMGLWKFFLSEKGTSDLANKIDLLCNLFESQFGIFECLHGVGHGVLAYEDYNLPKAIETCNKLRTVYDRRSCYGGLFMENVVTGLGVGAIPGHETDWVSEDAQFPCNGIDNEYILQYECYQMQTSWMLHLNSYDFEKVAEECLKVPENMIPVCFKSYGRDAAGHTLRNPIRMKELCDKIPKEKDYYSQCITGGVNVIIDFWGPALKDQATGFCKVLDSFGKRICYVTLAGRLGDVFNNDEERKVICDTFEKEYRDYCVGY